MTESPPEQARRADPNALRFLIGRELRDARERAKKSQRQAAEVLACTQTKINYLESGRNQQQPAEITALLTFYGQFTAVDTVHVERLAALATQADQSSWLAPFGSVFPDWFKIFVGLEGLASRVFTYEQTLLPGQLQTPDYAAALLEGHLRVAPINAPHVVAARMARQRLTGGANPLGFCVVIEEAVLDRIVGGPAVMAAQLEHVLNLMERENVELHVMPITVAVHDGLDGEVMLLDFDDAQSIGYIEYPDGAVYVQQPEQVALYKMAADRLCRAALSESDSADLIRRRISTLSAG
ncbi:helix-turn-helix domain-containing protein [Nocardia asteroides]|uniref:helix-turn-helix domain-containing protein n=1 Tax=Nocardia asteroides TaxID=1824 RepID=UPI001E5A75E4|nr:helix-turn-helix transcriptional regulator [Nocardia asteroides]UGT59867.1 helix-turn-helix domain-containing protein [Nocardia asteroides]